MPKFREITGQFVGYVPDTPDADHTPDRSPMNGTVTFTPVFTGGVISYPTLTPPEFAHPRPIRAKIVDGFVLVEVSEGTGDEAVTVLQPLSLMVSVDDEATQVWSYRADFDEMFIPGDDFFVKLPSWSFRVPDGVGPIDLSEMLPVKSAGGGELAKGPRGTGLESITAVDGQLVFEYTDSQSTTIPVPEAVAGPEGPQGPPGDPGLPGVPGEPGPAGEIPDLLVSNITDATPTGKNLMLAATEGAARNALGLAAGAVTNNGSLTELNTGTSSTPRVWTPANIANYVTGQVEATKVYTNVKDYGAVGDGEADDTAALQAAHDAGQMNVLYPAGDYKISSSIVVPSDQKVYGTPKTVIRSTGVFSFFRIYAGTVNVEFDGLVLEGTMPEDDIALVRDEYGISVEGVWDNNARDITVRNCTFRSMQGRCIHIRHTEGFRVLDSTFRRYGYLGVSVMSSRQGDISGNHLFGTGKFTNYSPNSYGISLSAAELPDKLGTPESPKSSDITIARNKVVNQVWTGIDSHVGERITIADNHVRNCDGTGISVLYSDPGATTINGKVGPNNIIIRGNIVESDALLNTSTNIGAGILLRGSVSNDLANKDYATGIISGNIVKRMGRQDSPSIGAITVGTSRGVIVSDNLIEECRSNGIILLNALDTRISGNEFIDLWKTTGAVPLVNVGMSQESSMKVIFESNVVTRGRLTVGGDLPAGSGFSSYVLSGTNSSNVEFVESGNVLGGATGYTSAPVRYSVLGGNQRVGRMAAAPSTGTWSRGDLVYNSLPSVSSPLGWVCVTAGSPGVWANFGTVS